MFGGRKFSSARSLDDQIDLVRARSQDQPRQSAVDLVTLLSVRGLVAMREGRDDDALADRRVVGGLLRGFDGEPLPVPHATARMAWMALAVGEAGQGRLEDALDAAERATALMADPETDDLAVFGAFFSDVTLLYKTLAQAGRAPEALRAAGAAAEVARILAGVDERRFGALAGVAGINQALALVAVGQVAAAVDVIVAVVHRYRESGHDQGLLLALSSQAAWFRQLGRLEEAHAAETEALDLARTRTGDPDGPRSLVVRLTSLLVTRQRLGLLDLAEAAGDEALSLLPSPSADHPWARETAALAAALNSLAIALARAGQPDAAARVGVRTVALQREVCSAPGADRGALGNALGNHADFLLALGQADRAVAVAREAMTIFEGLDDPVRYDRFERAVLDTLCKAQAAVGDHAAAVASAERAVALSWDLTQRDADFRPRLADSLDVLADRCRDSGDLAAEHEARAEASGLRADRAS